jgi:dTMP kinase
MKVLRGRLVSFEGLDGAGKTTQMDLLERWLIDQDVRYLRTREPGGTDLGVEIRELLLHRPELEITPLAEAFLFQADRAQHFATKIVPALDAGMLVVTDRCFDSSIAYQGLARGMGVELIEQLSLIATGGLVPDLTLFLDLDLALARSRKEEQDRLDAESEEFQRSLRTAFLALAQAHAQRIKIVDASRTPQMVHQQIISLLQSLLQEMRSHI